MEFKEAVKQIEKSEKNVDKVLKAGRLERHERQPMDFERYKFTLYFIAGMVAMIGGFMAVFMIIYFCGTQGGIGMPRVSINKNKYLQRDLREWITGRMDTLEKTQEYMGGKLNMSQANFGYRLRNSTFTNSQLPIIFKELEATDEEILRLMRL